MSINFYLSQDEQDLLARCTLTTLKDFADRKHIPYSENNSTGEITFKFQWKLFNDMVREQMVPEKRYQNLNFVKIIDSPIHKVTIIIPLHNKPLVLTQQSGINFIANDIVQASSDTDILIKFAPKKRVSRPFKQTGGYVFSVFDIIIVICFFILLIWLMMKYR